MKTKWGILVRRERWCLSWRGRLAAILAVVLAGFALLREIRPFLAATHRVPAQYLVMEGWVHLSTARAAAAEFRAGGYQAIYVTGEPEEGTGDYQNDSDTEAWVGADLLRRCGIPEQFLQRVPRRQVDRDRTYGSALALKEWFQEHHLVVHDINVVTEDAHARRTWLMFQEAFGPEVQVGVISVPDTDYDAEHWWRYSEGVREILGESIAYVYAKFFFWPDKGKS